MSEFSRREFAKLIAAAGMASRFRPQAGNRTIGIQVGAVSFVDEGVDSVLDRFQRDANVNALFIATFIYGRGIGGRQVPGQPLPDRPHTRAVLRTSLKKIQAPDHAEFDVLASVPRSSSGRRAAGSRAASGGPETEGIYAVESFGVGH